eukprot:SAG11_NODE_1901_length_4091_cov_1.742485_2_plen_767_part_01
MYDATDYIVLGCFAFDMLIKSIQGGMFLPSGPTDEYVADTWNLANLLVMVLIAVSLVVGSIDQTMDPYVRLIKGIAPMVGLMQMRGIRKIVVAWLQTLPATFTVFVPVFFIAVMFAIVGQDLFAGRLKRCICRYDMEEVAGLALCADPSGYRGDDAMALIDDGSDEALIDVEYWSAIEIVNRTTCEARGDNYLWTNPPEVGNFDSVFAALVTLFNTNACGYMDLMEALMDIPEEKDALPQENASKVNVLYMCAFHIVFTLFLMNLFIGVMSAHFSVQNGKSILTDGQRRHRHAEQRIEKFEPEFSYEEKYRPTQKTAWHAFRRPFFSIATSSAFNGLCYMIILMNVVFLSLLKYPTLGHIPEEVFYYVNIGTNCWFTLECVIRFIAVGTPRAYYKDSWNVFDFFVVASAWLLIAGKAPSGLESLRVIRCFKLVSAVRSLNSLTELIDVVLICILDSGRVFAVGGAVFYIYSVVGMKTFGQYESLNSGDFSENDFSSFEGTMKTLFQIMCGSGYTEILAAVKWEAMDNSDGEVQDLVDSMGNSELLAFVYFCTFTIMSAFIILNLFIVNVLDTFDVEMPISDCSVEKSDLWGFAFCWAGLTMSTAACPSLQVADARDFQLVLDKVLAAEEELAAKKDVTVIVTQIPAESYSETTIKACFEKFGETVCVLSQACCDRGLHCQTDSCRALIAGEVFSVKLTPKDTQEESQAWVVFHGLDRMVNGGMEKMLMEPVELSGATLTVKKSKSSFQNKGVMVKLPGEEADKTATF